MWLGAALFFGSVVAPAIFSVLRAFELPLAGEIAGAIVNRCLAAVNLSGFIVAVVLLLTAFLAVKSYSRLLLSFELAALAVMAVGTGVGHWFIAAKMHALRLSMSAPIDRVPLDDPRRVAFNSLHGYSVATLGIAMIAALVIFFVAARRSRS
jgi:hypothetical protein